MTGTEGARDTNFQYFRPLFPRAKCHIFLPWKWRQQLSPKWYLQKYVTSNPLKAVIY